MFHRRRASSHSTASRHTTPSAPTPSAAAAATQAFAKTQSSNGTLSAAAAAAALRTHPTPPTTVGNATTKRLQRRDSNASSASGVGGQRPDTLQRRGSAGSMTERTFRSPSPHRSSPVVQTSRGVPPVPAVPTHVAERERTFGSHKRTSSLEPPMRVHSPPLTAPRGRGVSLDRSPTSSPLSPTSAGSSRLSKVLELEREESKRSSINFSRPMSQSTSPAPQSDRPQSMGFFTGPVVSNQKPRQTLEPLRPEGASPPPPADISFAPQRGPKPVEAPLMKKKKRTTSAGSHFAAGTTKLTGTAIEALGSRGEQDTDRGTTKTRTPRYSTYSDLDGLHNSGDSSSETSSLTGRDKSRAWSTRPVGLLSKQPSVVHERPEGEEQVEETTSANTGKKVDSASKSSLEASRYAVPSSATSSATDRSVQSQAENASPIRVNGNGKPSFLEANAERKSISPSRTAHFSVVPVEETNEIKHSPPGRSVSPYKSALKHSPSSSLRNTSPEAQSGHGHARTGSLVHEEAPRPKKTARVSFDDTPMTVVTGLEASKYAVPDRARRTSEDDLEEVMKPRPALPSFGSVRGRKDIEETRNLPRSSGRRTPSPLADSQSTLIGVDRSNDHAVGGIIAKDFADKQQASNAPLPPEVTSVEGSGYDSDSDSTFTTDSTMAQPAGMEKSAPPARISQGSPPGIPHASESDTPEVIPSIALIPPTPAAEEEADFNIPGAFPEDEGEFVPKADELTLRKDRQFPVVTQTDGFAINERTENLTQPPVTLKRLVLPVDDESSDSDTSSIYSDAAEDPDEYGGFASLDAILESTLPLNETEPVLSSKTEKVLKDSDLSKAPPSPTAAHWDTTTAYWRSLSDKRKAELEQRALEEEKRDVMRQQDANTIAEPIHSATSPEPEPRQKKASTRPTAIPETATLRGTQPAKKPRHMKGTLRNDPEPSNPEPEPGTHMRSSLRSGGSMPTTMRGSITGRGQSPGLSASRWSSPPAPRESKGALQKKRIPMAQEPAIAPAALIPKSKSPVLAKTLRRTNSADSVSSFKRQKSRPTNPDGKVTMRRSMRDASPQQAGLGSSKFSVRSLSPTGSNSNYHMRSSLRGSLDSNVPTIRTPEKKSRFKSPTRFGRSKKSPKEAPAPKTPPPKYKSRFSNDSDDDDSDVPRTAFVSRFVDSDDDLDSPTSPDMPSGLTPVRGIPRRAGDERDSTDLEDESPDERIPIPNVPSTQDVERAHAVSQANGHAQGAALANGSLREPADGLAASKHAPRPDIKKRRLSFLSRSKTRSSSVPATSSHSFTSSRPGTSDSTTRSPKLQRKVTPLRLPQLAEDSWPLPPTGEGAADEDRPRTSEGVPTSAPLASRPDIGKRRSTADPFVGVDRKVSFSTDPVYSSKTGKKKKFPRLRRMFGLND